MNRFHRWYCRSDFWRRTVERRLLPWVLDDRTLDGLEGDLLEVGPGPGVVTDILRRSPCRLTSLEIDPALAQALRAQFSESEVTVVEGDATKMPFENARFSIALSMTMLHHVPSPDLQDHLLREVHRVLRPGGLFMGSDSRSDGLFEIAHWRDTLVPVEPASFGERLEAAGFEEISVESARKAFRFRARRPRPGPSGPTP
ncbi:MAG TPA: class I SAM-dependent methyltransferase [Deltaproteobacteria bacterium]|nr:class I SAM-dependent methyltransferase [Deltaproteobacteria bacterium]